MSIKLYLLSRPRLDYDALSSFLSDQATSWNKSELSCDSQNLIEISGRVCYMSFGQHQSPKTNAQYLDHLIKMGHESVLEHSTWTFIVTGVTRAFSHQMVRHRVGFSYSQLSQQYHDESDATFVEPNELENFPKAREEWLKSLSVARESYVAILNSISTDSERLGFDSQPREARRAVRSIARSILPNATETKLVFTANARALRHFLHIRGSITGDAEMRSVASELLRLMQEEAPAIFADFVIETLPDGSTMAKKRSSST